MMNKSKSIFDKINKIYTIKKAKALFTGIKGIKGIKAKAF